MLFKLSNLNSNLALILGYLKTQLWTTWPWKITYAKTFFTPLNFSPGITWQTHTNFAHNFFGEKSCKSFGFHIGLTAQMIWSGRCKFICVWTNVYHSFCVVPKHSLANSMKIDWNFQGRSQGDLKRPNNGNGGGSRLKISKGALATSFLEPHLWYIFYKHNVGNSKPRWINSTTTSFCHESET